MTSHFLRLPREIRDEIYEYCLLFDGELIPYPTLYDREDGETNQGQEMPCTALLALNQTIRAEAEHVLYSKNTWRMSDVQSIDDTHWNGFEFRHDQIREISIKFDSRALYPKQVLRVSKVASTGPLAIHGYEQREEAIHQARGMILTYLWERTTWYVWMIQDLKTLRIDFANCCCSNGCCRLVIEAVNNMDPYDRAPLKVQKVVLINAEQVSNIVRPDPRKLGNLTARLCMPLWDLYNTPAGWTDNGLAKERRRPDRRVLITATGLISEQEQVYIHSIGFHCEYCFIGRKDGDAWKWYCSRPRKSERDRRMK